MQVEIKAAADRVRQVLRKQAEVGIPSPQSALPKAGVPPTPPSGDQPTGVPKPVDNLDRTDSLYPTKHQEPTDPGFTTKQIVSGSGTGPAVGGEGAEDSGSLS